MRRPRAAVDGSALDLPVPMIDGDGDRLIAELELEVAQLREALQTRTQIGVATGMLAQRFDCCPDRAWSVLVRVSQAMNVKVRDIARVLVNAQAGQVPPEEIKILGQLSEHLPAAWQPSESGDRGTTIGR